MQLMQVERKIKRGVRHAIFVSAVLCCCVPWATAADSLDAHIVPLGRVIGQPEWKDIPLAQRTLLAPLETDWANLSAPRRKFWLDIAKRYPSMAPAQQNVIRERIASWSQLTPDQRKIARDHYQRLRQATPEKRAQLKAAWDSYNQLPEEQKRTLSAQAREQLKSKRQASISGMSSTIAPTTAPSSPPLTSIPLQVPPQASVPTPAAPPTPSSSAP
jgi:hypothetical protein